MKRVSGIFPPALPALIALVCAALTFTAAPQGFTGAHDRPRLDAQPQPAGRWASRKSVCGFDPAGAEDEWHNHKQVARRSAGAARFGPQLASKEAAGRARVEEHSEIAVIEADAAIVLPPNKFDLKNKSLVFTPEGDGYRVERGDVDFNSELGDRIGYFYGAGNSSVGHLVDDSDDGYRELELFGAQFPFFGTRYGRMFVGTNGYITFAEADTSARISPATLAAESPRIAPLWADLDVTDKGDVYYNRIHDRHVITWNGVGQSSYTGTSTFQAHLYDDGRIAFVYKKVKARSALVGLSPGASAADAEPLDLSDPPEAAVTGPFFETFSKQKRLDVPALTRAFYSAYGDQFDTLYLWTDFAFDNGLGVAHAFNVRNEVRGIGLRVFDRGALYGSAARLSSVIIMGNAAADWPADPQTHVVGLNSAISIVCHEQGHRWLSYVLFDAEHDIKDDLLGRQRAHWSFLVDTRTTNEGNFSSLMEGNAWRDNGNGTFTTLQSSVNFFTPLDQYLMGLRSAEEVGTVSYLVVDEQLKAILRSKSPVASFSLSATRKVTNVGQIVEREGARVPSADEAQKDFRVACILITERGVDGASSTVAQLDRYRNALERYFSVATDRRGSLSGAIADARSQE